MVRTKKPAVATVSSSQAIQSSSIHGNDFLSLNHPLPWGVNQGNQGCQQGFDTTQGGGRAPDPSQQQQILEYLHRERERKTTKIKKVFNDLTQEEVDVMLMDCACNEDEVIQRLQKRPDYLEGIRRIVSTVLRPSNSTTPLIENNHSSTDNGHISMPATSTQQQQKVVEKQPTSEQQQQQQQQSTSNQQLKSPQHPIKIRPSPTQQLQQEELPTKNDPLITNNTLHPTTRSLSSEDATVFFKRDSKKRSRMIGRLALDDALRQIKDSPNKAFEGWSQARIRAFQMIEQNPNSYYYRFNAPGEEQRKGPWTEEEKKLFFKRLEEVGSNGQWGIFSTAIPGRVGYQCSNYYRLLIESGQLQDPNYIVDDKGKAHYLFDKRGSDGRVEKTFRTHSPHIFGSKKAGSNELAHKKKKKADEEEDDGDKSGTFKMNLRSSARLAAKAHTRRSNTVP